MRDGHCPWLLHVLFLQLCRVLPVVEDLSLTSPAHPSAGRLLPSQLSKVCPSLLLLLCTLQLLGEGRAGHSTGRRCLLDGTRKKIFKNTFSRQVFLFALALQTGVVVLKINTSGDMAADLQLPHDSCLRNTEHSRSLDAQFKVHVFRRTVLIYLSGQKSK